MTSAGLPPGHRTPGIVNALGYARDPLGYVRRYHRRHGPVASARFPGIGLGVLVADPELIREIFSTDPSVARAGEANATVLEPTLGANSLLTLDEAPHMRQRKLLLPAFHGDRVSRWGETIRAVAERDMEAWPVGEPFLLRSRTQRITLEVILRAVFGVRDEERFRRAEGLINAFAKRVAPLTAFPFLRRNLGPFGPFARFSRAREALDEFIYEEIALRRDEPDVAERDDVLSLLLGSVDEHGQPMTEAELRDELVTVIGAGHETTATALAWTFERLLRTPDVLERLRGSLREGDAYLDATIKETLRVRPIITETARRLTRDIELGGYRIPAGTNLVPAIAATHFREDLYPEPDAFQPERFLGGSTESYAWIPFGGGVRRCIGASFAQFEMRIVIRAILERAQLRAADPAPERPRLRNITVAPEHGCRVVLERPLRTSNARPLATERPTRDRSPSLHAPA